jgi:predicted metal-dependent enzyme (double-stranded beta helix superfamily)
MAPLKDKQHQLPGLQRMIHALDTAVAGRSASHAFSAVRNVLPLLVSDTAIQLPAAVYQPHPQHYLRRELYRSREHGYSVVAMTWAPGQGTPLHDHEQQWCVEAVWAGQLEITPYVLLAQDGDCYRFSAGAPELARHGDCSAISPPGEHHTVRNPHPSQVAVSVHVYQRAIEQCTMFTPRGDHHHRQALALDCS